MRVQCGEMTCGENAPVEQIPAAEDRKSSTRCWDGDRNWFSDQGRSRTGSEPGQDRPHAELIVN